MLHTLLSCGALVAVTVAVHAAGLSAVLVVGTRLLARPPTSFWPIAWLLIRLTWWLILIHLVEISVWGSFYSWQECLPDTESAFYFSGVTYTTVGYGDVLLAEQWRLFAPVEGLTGIFFALVSRLFGHALETKSS